MPAPLSGCTDAVVRDARHNGHIDGGRSAGNMVASPHQYDSLVWLPLIHLGPERLLEPVEGILFCFAGVHSKGTCKNRGLQVSRLPLQGQLFLSSLGSKKFVFILNLIDTYIYTYT